MNNQQKSEINKPFSMENKIEGMQSTNTVASTSTTGGLHVGNLLRKWADISKINYLSSQPLDVVNSGQSVLRRSSIGSPEKEYSIQCFVPSELRNASEENLFTEQFPIHVTRLMNEDQLWGCFYTFPELYADVYSPVVHIRSAGDVPEIVEGELTRDTITPHLTYLKRTPLLGDFVYIKLDLSSKNLINIKILQQYKYLVYLDLSSNLLTDLSVLSYLPYLQFLSVAFNRLNTVLEYDTPQWFLTEVYYKYNSVNSIRDLNQFWSITILDLSHNNIKHINGLENLRFLRRLDLSFNHIQRLENLNHLRLLWLDLSYNNISSFESGPNTGLWTLLHLEYLNLNENNLVSMRIFSGCTRIRELNARNNRFSMLLELAVYMRQMRRLIVLDLRANPVCLTHGYKDVVINTFPILLNLDAEELDPVVQRTFKMKMAPDIHIFATRRLQRLLYIQLLSRARISSYTPPADTTEVPIIVLVGYEAVGKGSLARRLAAECNANIALARQHTTARHHYPEHYRKVTRSKFDDMLLTGDFLTYSEMNGESYGLSREEAFIKDGKVKIVSMDLLGALMLKLRGRRPYLILTSYSDKKSLSQRQLLRKSVRNMINRRVSSAQRSTLQVVLSDRFLITGILNEILLCLPEGKEQSEFAIECQCPLMVDGEASTSQGVQDYANSSTTSLEETCKHTCEKSDQMDPCLYSLYKESQGTGEYGSYLNGQNSNQGDRKQDNPFNNPRQSKTKQDKLTNVSHPKSVDFRRYNNMSSTAKGLPVVPDGSKSSKSVTFSSQDCTDAERKDHMDPMGMIIEPRSEKEMDNTKIMRSVSTRMPRPIRRMSQLESSDSFEDQDLWFAFLTETGLLEASDTTDQSNTETVDNQDTRVDDPDLIVEQMSHYHQVPYETATSTIRDDYEDICRKCPGLFWDTVIMDDPEKAFKKTKKIIREIVESQKNIKPMFDVDFVNLKHYPNVERRLSDIRKGIAQQRCF